MTVYMGNCFIDYYKCLQEMKFNKDSSSQLTVYSRDGAYPAKAYHFVCSRCKKRYWHSYAEEKRLTENITYRTYDKQCLSEKYFMTTRATACENAFMREVIVDCELGRSFEDNSERFNRLYATAEERGRLNKTRLEDAFFLSTLIKHLKDNITVHVDSVSNRPDYDHLCDQVIENVFSSGSKWVKHKCDIPGCSEGFVMCDGNEKLSRRICAAPRHSFKLSRSMPKIISRCGNSPVFGRAHQKASKYCKSHTDLDTQQPKTKQILLTINMPDQTVSSRIVDLSDTLPSNDDTSVHVPCKKAANVHHFHDRTAGIMAIVRPCGIVIDWREMYTCESASQLFIQLLKIVDEPGSNVRYVGYDRACEFAPFLRNLRAKGNAGADKLLEETDYLVDNFHIAGHTTNACNPDHPDCEYHHSLPKFADIANANTECAEQCFSWLKRYKNIVKYMTAPRFRFYMHVVISAHNNNIEKKASSRS
jgi:hypothetical protein